MKLMAAISSIKPAATAKLMTVLMSPIGLSC